MMWFFPDTAEHYAHVVVIGRDGKVWVSLWRNQQWGDWYLMGRLPRWPEEDQ